MKTPKDLGYDTPTKNTLSRRVFLRGVGAAATMSVSPTAILAKLPDIGVSSISPIVSFLSSLKMSSTFNPFEGDIYFNDGARESLLDSQAIFHKIFGENSQLLDYLNLEKSCISPTNKGTGSNILSNAFMNLVFEIPGKSYGDTNEFTINLGPSDFGGIISKAYKGYWYLKSGGKTYKIPRIPGDELTSLQGELGQIIDDLSSRAINIETGKYYNEELKENSQLPHITTEFSELMDEILSGKVEVTDEVRHKIWYLLSL